MQRLKAARRPNSAQAGDVGWFRPRAAHLDNGSERAGRGAVLARAPPSPKPRSCHYGICHVPQWAKVMRVIDGSRQAIYSAVNFLWQ